MTNDRHIAARAKSLMMAFGHMRHEGIVFAGLRAHIATQTNADKCVCIKQAAAADSYGLYFIFLRVLNFIVGK